MKTVATLVASALVAGGALARKPNILHILIDDMGFNELSPYNSSRHLVTPNVQRVADEGVTLMHYYTQPICSPTRSALMAGQYPTKIGTQSNVIYWDTPWAPFLGPNTSEAKFFPEWLEPMGYKERPMFGKWHLGMFSPRALPPSRGFTQWAGYSQGCGSYYTHISSNCSAYIPPPKPPVDAPEGPIRSWPEAEAEAEATSDDPSPPWNPNATQGMGYDWYKDMDIDISAKGTYSLTLLQDHATSFIHQQGAKANEAASVGTDADPWYMYLPLQNVHGPIEVPAKWAELYPELENDPHLQVLCGMISAADAAIGAVMDAVRASGQAEDTVVIIASDNGAPPTADTKTGPDNMYLSHRNYPKKGWKTQLWEGGTNVPAIVWAPGRIQQPGRQSDRLVHVTDLLPTVLSLAGDPSPVKPGFSGHNVWADIATPDGPRTRTEMLYNINPLCDDGQAGKPKAALRIGAMKLLTECWDAGKHAPTGQQYLYNLTADPNERSNLINNPGMQSIHQELLDRLAAHSREMVTPMQWEPPFQGSDYWCAKCARGNTSQPYNAWRPWIQ